MREAAPRYNAVLIFMNVDNGV